MASRIDPDMLDEYDFTGDARGKYAARYQEGTNIVRLDDDVAAMFPSSEQHFVMEMLDTVIQQAAH